MYNNDYDYLNLNYLTNNNILRLKSGYTVITYSTEGYSNEHGAYIIIMEPNGIFLYILNNKIFKIIYIIKNLRI